MVKTETGSATNRMNAGHFFELKKNKFRVLRSKLGNSTFHLQHSQTNYVRIEMHGTREFGYGESDTPDSRRCRQPKRRRMNPERGHLCCNRSGGSHRASHCFASIVFHTYQMCPR